MNTSTSLITYDWISKGRFWLTCAVSPVFLAVGIGLLCLEHFGWRITGGVLVLFGLAMVVQKKTYLDKSHGALLVVHRFLGFCPLWQRTLRFDQFDAVVIEMRKTYHPSWPREESQNYDICYRVGLRRRVGRPCWIRDDSFRYGQPSLRVEEFARRLSGDTGLEIVEVEV